MQLQIHILVPYIIQWPKIKLCASGKRQFAAVLMVRVQWFFAPVILLRELKMCCGEGEILECKKNWQCVTSKWAHFMRVRFILKHTTHSFIRVLATPPHSERKSAAVCNEKWNDQNVTTVHTLISVARVCALAHVLSFCGRRRRLADFIPLFAR